MVRKIITLAGLCFMLLLAAGAITAQEATPQEPETYVIQPGDTLLSIARRYGTTVQALTQENNITNPELIYWGQRIRIPAAQPTAEPTQPQELPAETDQAEQPSTPPEVTEDPLATPAPEITAEATAEVASPTPAPIQPDVEFGYGVEANFYQQDVSALGGTVGSLGVDWVKQVINWRDFEPVQGAVDFATLDSIIEALESQNVQILLTITTAPDWTRSILEEDGPPDDFAHFGSFVQAVASRYAGRVAAYQIWSEPNLRNRWRSTVYPINAESYLSLLQQGYEAVKAADPAAAVISAGLAVTGFNDALNAEAGDPVNAVNDRVYLNGLYAAGLAQFADGIGVHPIGWANPPDARCCEPAPGVETHYEDASFYFLHTLEDYRQIQINHDDAATPLWVTRFAWGTSEDIGQADAANVFTSYTSLQEQADYTVRAYEIGVQLGYIGPMFAYNLNGCHAGGREGFSSCYYSFIGPDGAPRPVFQAVQNRQSSAAPAPTTDSVVTEAAPVTEIPATSPPEITPEVTLEVTLEATFEVGP